MQQVKYTKDVYKYELIKVQLEARRIKDIPAGIDGQSGICRASISCYWELLIDLRSWIFIACEIYTWKAKA